MAALVLAVAVDEVLGDDGPAATGETTGGAEPAATLAALGARGTLVYTDRECRFHAVRLPSLRPARPPAAVGVSCWFELSPAGTRVAPKGAAWTGSGPYARCTSGSVELRAAEDRFPLRVLDGCAPAWRTLPDRSPTLTLVRDRAVLLCDDASRCETVIPASAVEAAARDHPNVPGDGPPPVVDVVDLAWLARDRAALLLRIRIPRVGPEDLIVVFEDGRVRGSYFFLDTDRDQLEPSPRGRYVAAGTGFVARADGPRLAVPNAFGRVRELAWSPDERWLALAARGTLALVRLEGEGAPRVVTLPFDATDVGWAPG